MATSSVPAPEYEPVSRWAKIPHGVTFRAGANAVAVDADDQVFVFNRGSDPVAIFDRDGNFLDSWGHGEFENPHGITIGPNGDLFLIDDRAHFVQRRSPEGKLLLTLGTPGQSTEAQSGAPFNRPTDVAVSESGDIFVTDGYRNSRVHHFAADGTLLGGWGAPGSEPGQFSLPHGICWTPSGSLAVCDRENHRVQLFSADGSYLDEWPFHRPVAIASRPGLDAYLYIVELGPQGSQRGVPNIGLKVRVVDEGGRIVSTFGDGTLGEGPRQFIAPHGISVDSRGDVYVAEVSALSLKGHDGVTSLGETVSLRKWRRTN
jgi:streptogramin lyase